MNSNDFLACLGKPDDAAEVQKMLGAVGVTKKLKMPSDDIEARADLPKLGLSLIFKPEAPRSSVLIFQAVQFFSDAEKGFKNFVGALPKGLTLTDTQGDVRAKLGKPSDQFRELGYQLKTVHSEKVHYQKASDSGVYEAI